ncbi:MAG: glycosyltransferase family 39 protein [bacterium]|nr:glycosyltransferase family 39 protein [bacterium]
MNWLVLVKNFFYRFKEPLIVLFFLLVALSLWHFYKPYPSFWLDESATFNLANQSNAGIIRDLLYKWPHPPLYFFLIKFWGIYLGDSEFSLRFPSLIFFLLTIVFTYLLTKELFSKRTAYFSLPLSAANYFLIWFSHQARPYEMLAFFSVASFYFFELLLKKINKKRIAGYIIATVLGLYLHFWFVLVFFAQFIFVLILRKEIEFKKIFLAMFFSGFVFLPWAYLYLTRFEGYYVSEAIKKATLGDLWETLKYLAWGQEVLLIGVLIFVSAGFILRSGLWDKFKKNKGSQLLIVYFFMPLVSAFVISQFLPIYTSGRREIIIAPAWIGLVAFIFSRIKSTKWFVAVSFLVLLFSTQAIINSNATMDSFKSDDRKIIYEVLSDMKDGDAVILGGFSGINFDYYFKRYEYEKSRDLKIRRIYIPTEIERLVELEVIKKWAEDEAMLGKFLNDKKQELDKMLKQNNVYLFAGSDVLTPKLINFFDKNFNLVRKAGRELPNMPSYISEIRVYSLKKN